MYGGYENDNRTCPDVTATPVVSSHSSRGLDGSVSNHSKYIDQINKSSNCMSGDVDDDNILEVIYYTLINLNESNLFGSH